MRLELESQETNGSDQVPPRLEASFLWIIVSRYAKKRGTIESESGVRKETD